MSRHLARLSFRPVAISGSIVLVAGAVGLLTVAPGQAVLWLCICCVAIGAGLGVNSLVFTVAVQSSVARADRGRAMALFYFSRLIGQALGAAAFGGVLNRGLALAAPGTMTSCATWSTTGAGQRSPAGSRAAGRDAGRCAALGLHPGRHHRRRRVDRDLLRAAPGTAGPGTIGASGGKGILDFLLSRNQRSGKNGGIREVGGTGHYRRRRCVPGPGSRGAAYKLGRKERVTLIEFESMDKAVATHESDTYKQALKALDGGAVRDIRFVEGL